MNKLFFFCILFFLQFSLSQAQNQEVIVTQPASKITPETTAPITAYGKVIINYTKVDSFTLDQMKEKWKKGHVPRIVMPVKYGVDVYEVTYITCWKENCFIKASGLYFVPVNPKKAMPMVIYNHGTAITDRKHIDYNGESQIAFIFATTGYGVLFPDYVGLGKGDGQHLYIHAESEANAGIDLLKAGEYINEKEGWKTNEQLFITGYSQGGHATMAVAQKIQAEFSDRWKVTAASPMSGPYDLVNTQGTVMFEEYTQPHYLPYLLKGYNQVYKIVPEEDFLKLFVAPYDTLVDIYFDGEHTLGEVNKALPSIPANMIRKEFMEKFLHDPDFPFKKYLEENNVYNWKPEHPIQLCYCIGDEEVKWENAKVAHEKFVEQGVKTVKLRRVGGKKFTHRACADYAVAYTKFYFDSFRRGSKKGRRGPLVKRWLIAIDKGLKKGQ